MAPRLNPPASRFADIKRIVEYAQTSSEHGREAAELLAQMSTVWAVAPQTDGERSARRAVYQAAVAFVYEHDLK